MTDHDIDKKQENTGASQEGSGQEKIGKKRISSLKDIRRRKTRRRRIILIAVLAVLIVGGYFLISTRRAASASAELAAAQAGSAYTVTTRTYREEVEISGNVEPIKSGNLFFRTTGEVKEVYVDEGDTVSPGDVVAKLRIQTKEYELAQLEYELEQAQFDGSRKQIELLKMRKELLLDDIQNSYLKAGIRGIVSKVNIEPGDLVSASGAEPAVRVIDTSSLKTTVEVDEFDINSVRAGQRVELIFDALGSAVTVAGRVRHVPLEGSVTGQGIAVKMVEIVIDNPPESISPSYTFSGVIIAGDRQEILTFPQTFLVRVNDTQRVLKQREDGTTEPVTVRTAYFEAGLVRLLSGNLSEGDVIVRQAADRTGRSPFAFQRPPGAGR